MTRRVRSVALAAFVPALALSLGSCSRAFEIEVSGYGPNIRLEFRDRAFLRSFRQATCLKELRIYEQIDPTGQPQLVWQIKAAAHCITLTGIDVGHIPDGFEQEVSGLPLKIGHRYQASADAEKDYPNSGISSRWFVCRKWPEQADWKNDQELRPVAPSCLR